MDMSRRRDIGVRRPARRRCRELGYGAPGTYDGRPRSYEQGEKSVIKLTRRIFIVSAAVAGIALGSGTSPPSWAKARVTLIRGRARASYQ
jgi:hypothetical protein